MCHLLGVLEKPRSQCKNGAAGLAMSEHNKGIARYRQYFGNQCIDEI